MNQIKTKKIKERLSKNNQYLMIIFLIFGFLFDNFTLTRIDRIYDNFVVLSHLLIVFVFTGFLAYFNYKKKTKFKNEILIKTITNFFISFSLGGLFSAFAVFYLRSGQVFQYLPFVFLLLIFMIATEIFKHWLGRVQIVFMLLVLAVQSYLAFLIPIFLNQLNSRAVFFSGLFSFLIIFLYLLLWKKTLKIPFNFFKFSFYSIAVILIFQIFYFFNLIPPAPLSAKVLLPAYEVERNKEENSYLVTYPKLDFWQELESQITGPDFFYQTGDRIYFFSSIFAPDNMTAQIEHRWYRKENSKFIEKSRIPIQITGGRDDGFRGYSFKQSLGSGKWRVDVTTFDGKVIGRSYFFLIEKPKQNELPEVEKILKAY